MTNSVKYIVVVGIFALILAAQNANAASADPVDIEPGLAAKVSRERLKQTQANGAADEFGGKKDSSECGNIDIGNSDNSKSAANRIAPREKTVVITGPVINATKCR